MCKYISMDYSAMLCRVGKNYINVGGYNMGNKPMNYNRLETVKIMHKSQISQKCLIFLPFDIPWYLQGTFIFFLYIFNIIYRVCRLYFQFYVVWTFKDQNLAKKNIFYLFVSITNNFLQLRCCEVQWRTMQFSVVHCSVPDRVSLVISNYSFQ